MPEPTPPLTAAAKETRRKLAVRNVLDGRIRADVADFLGVHPIAVAEWPATGRAGTTLWPPSRCPAVLAS